MPNTIAMLWASPHTRGWTPDLPIRPFRSAGFPAHAGMDPGFRCCSKVSTGLPRTRGDGPRRLAPPSRTTRASPHTRGWTQLVGLGADQPHGFPAHAGMDPRRASRQASRPGLPRTRGDGPFLRDDQHVLDAASPHTRGWTVPDDGRMSLCPGFPAHAGMDPRRSFVTLNRAGLPRTRGDGPDLFLIRVPLGVASPHTRGWTFLMRRKPPTVSGFPAHAGMDPAKPTGGTVTTGLPRTRGDGPSRPSLVAIRRTASPHTRGWTRHLRRDPDGWRGFPAHAGMDP